MFMISAIHYATKYYLRVSLGRLAGKTPIAGANSGPYVVMVPTVGLISDDPVVNSMATTNSACVSEEGTTSTLATGFMYLMD